MTSDERQQDDARNDGSAHRPSETETAEGQGSTGQRRPAAVEPPVPPTIPPLEVIANPAYASQPHRTAPQDDDRH